MGQVTDKLLSGGTPEQESPRRGRVTERLLRPHDPYASAGDQAVGSVTTDVTPGGEAPGFGTQLHASFLDDPTTKLKVYAKARFPNEPAEVREARYGIHEGEVVYQTDDGKLMRETPDTFMDTFNRGLAEGTTRLPVDALAVLGAWLGSMIPGVGPTRGAGAGGVAGVQVKRLIAQFLGDEPSLSGNIKESVLEGGGAMLGEKTGEGVGWVHDAYQTAKGGTLGKAAGRDAIGMRAEDIARAEADAAKHGIELYPPQTTGSAALAQQWENLSGLPGTADIMQQAKAKQGPQTQQAIQNFINDLGPNWSRDKAGKQAVETAKKSIRKLELGRVKKTKPFYDKAFNKNTPIDLREVEELVDTILAEQPTGGSGERAIKKVQKMLYEDATFTVDGEEVTETVLIGRVSRRLDRVKKEINHMIEGPDAAVIERDVIGQLRAIQRKLVGDMRAVNPDYKAADALWEELSPPINARNASLIGQVSRITDPNVKEAAKKLFDAANTPGEVAYARHFIRKQNPEAWDAVVRTYLLDHFQKIKDSTRDIPNVAGGIRDKWIGNENQRQILRAAMGSKQFDNLIEFGRLMEKVSNIFKRESATFGKQEGGKQIKRQGSNIFATALETDMTAPLKKLGAWWNELSQAEYAENLARAMVDPAAAAKLKKMHHLSPKSKKFIKLFGAFIGADIGGQIAEPTPPDFAPAGKPVADMTDDEILEAIGQ